MNPLDVAIDHESGKYVIVIDASALKESSCLLRLFNKVVKGYRGNLNSNVIEFGTAFHIFRAILRRDGASAFGEGVRQAVEYYKTTEMITDPQKKYLTDVFLSVTCLGYFTKYNAKDNLEVLRFPRERFPDVTIEEHPEPEVALIEPWTKFVFPYYSDEHVDILLGGTMDELALMSRATLVVTDCKTSGVWKIKEYLDGYKLDPQLIFYVVVLRRYVKEFPNSVIAELYNKYYPICGLIDGVFYKGADQPVEYKRSDVIPFSEELLAEYDTLLDEKIMKLVSAVKTYKETGKPPIREGIINSSCMTKYGPCGFSFACAMPDEYSRQEFLNASFNQRHYNPLEFGGK